MVRNNQLKPVRNATKVAKNGETKTVWAIWLLRFWKCLRDTHPNQMAPEPRTSNAQTALYKLGTTAVVPTPPRTETLAVRPL